MAVKAHRIVIEPTSIRGERGQYYRVYFEDAVLIEDTWNLEFEACRALVAQGITGCVISRSTHSPRPMFGICVSSKRAPIQSQMISVKSSIGI